MNVNKIIYKIRQAFYKINNLDQIINNQITINRYVSLAMMSTEKGTCDDLLFEHPMIVSLTTYGLRINEVYLTVESLLHQTVKPNRIILWLDNSFKNSNIPFVLREQEKRGLEICYCEDIRSYTKLIPTLEVYPNSVIVTVDDDMIYTPDFIEHLANAYQKDNAKIYFYRGHKIVFDKKGNLASYLNWVKAGANGSSILNLPTGVCGVLYPPNCFHKDVTNRKVFMDICPYADDIWFKAMSLLNGVECEKIETGKDANEKFVYVETAVLYSLSNVNNVQGMNDVQISKVFEKYNLKSMLYETSF